MSLENRNDWVNNSAEDGMGWKPHRVVNLFDFSVQQVSPVFTLYASDFNGRGCHR